MNVDNQPHSIIACHPPEASDPPDKQSEPDPEYHQSREQAEREAAKVASSVIARRLHEELAQAHADLARIPGWPRGH